MTAAVGDVTRAPAGQSLHICHLCDCAARRAATLPEPADVVSLLYVKSPSDYSSWRLVPDTEVQTYGQLMEESLQEAKAPESTAAAGSVGRKYRDEGPI